MPPVQLFTYEDVSKHNNEKDIYMIIDKKVYDITDFLNEHPGGAEILIEEGAKDASGAFEDVGHSPEAREMLEKYYVGDVDPDSTPVTVEPPIVVHNDNGKGGNPLRIIIPVVFFLGYFYWRFFVHNA